MKEDATTNHSSESTASDSGSLLGRQNRLHSPCKPSSASSSTNTIATATTVEESESYTTETSSMSKPAEAMAMAMTPPEGVSNPVDPDPGEHSSAKNEAHPPLVIPPSDLPLEYQRTSEAPSKNQGHSSLPSSVTVDASSLAASCLVANENIRKNGLLHQQAQQAANNLGNDPPARAAFATILAAASTATPQGRPAAAGMDAVSMVAATADRMRREAALLPFANKPVTLPNNINMALPFTGEEAQQGQSQFKPLSRYVGFGIGECDCPISPNTSSARSATGVAIRAVRDALDRAGGLAFMNNAISSHARGPGVLAVKISLGIPPCASDNSPAVKNQKSLQQGVGSPIMDVDFTQVSVILPQGIKILPFEMTLGGLSLPTQISNDITETSNFISVVASVVVGMVQDENVSRREAAEKASLHDITDPEVLKRRLMERENEMRAMRNVMDTQHWRMRVRLGELEHIIQKTARDMLEREAQIDLLQKRLAIRDESIELMAHDNDELRLQIHTLTTAASTTPISQQQSQAVSVIPQQQHTALQSALLGLRAGGLPQKRDDPVGDANILMQHVQQENGRLQQQHSNISNVPASGTLSDSNGWTHVAQSTPRGSPTSLGKRDTPDASVSSQAISNTSNNESEASGAPRDRKLKVGLTAKKHARQFVTHNYHDHANDVPDAAEETALSLARRSSGSTFPCKLHELLDRIEVDGYADILSWLPHGRCFKIHKQQEFLETILPNYFVMTKKSSFLRQLNLYGFNRLSSGPDKGAYYHELFLKGMKWLCKSMVRMKINGNGIRQAGNPETEPNFYDMPPVRSNHFLVQATREQETDIQNVNHLGNGQIHVATYQSEQNEESSDGGSSSSEEDDEEDDESDDDGEPSKKNTRKKRRTSPNGVYTAFPTKLHRMLDVLEATDATDAVSWLPHGRAFLVYKQDVFVNEIMHIYFRQTKYSSFQRQLHMYGFRRITQGRDKGAYYHEHFLRGIPHLCEKIGRTRINGNGCRKPSDPDNEPDFYMMSPIPPIPRGTVIMDVTTSDRRQQYREQQEHSSGVYSSYDQQQHALHYNSGTDLNSTGDNLQYRNNHRPQMTLSYLAEKSMEQLS